MHIGALQTIRSSDNDNLLWLVLETDTGITGLGEAFFAPGAVENFVHEVIAPLVLGRDATQIGAINRELTRYPVGYASSGVEMRAAAALDMALWDCLGQRSGLPLHTLLGGRARDTIRIYNTCEARTTSPRRALQMWILGSDATANCKRWMTSMPSSTNQSVLPAICWPRGSPA